MQLAPIVLIRLRVNQYISVPVLAKLDGKLVVFVNNDIGCQDDDECIL